MKAKCLRGLDSLFWIIMIYIRKSALLYSKGQSFSTFLKYHVKELIRYYYILAEILGLGRQLFQTLLCKDNITLMNPGLLRLISVYNAIIFKGPRIN